ncbi:hypothetical protein ABFA07_010929 [Porites harrisoni]
MFGVRGKVKACNFVHNDEIWKDHVNRELLSQRRWPDKWGFLASEYRKLQQQTLRIGQEGLELQQEKNIDREPTEDSEEKGKTTKRVTRDEKVTFPETTSQMIGWKPKILQRNEVERHARGKQDIVKLFKWPREGV